MGIRKERERERTYEIPCHCIEEKALLMTTGNQSCIWAFTKKKYVTKYMPFFEGESNTVPCVSNIPPFSCYKSY